MEIKFPCCVACDGQLMSLPCHIVQCSLHTSNATTFGTPDQLRPHKILPIFCITSDANCCVFSSLAKIQPCSFLNWFSIGERKKKLFISQKLSMLLVHSMLVVWVVCAFSLQIILWFWIHATVYICNKANSEFHFFIIAKKCVCLCVFFFFFGLDIVTKKFGSFYANKSRFAIHFHRKQWSFTA